MTSLKPAESAQGQGAQDMPDGLFTFMRLFDDDALPDGAWQAALTEAVTRYNMASRTNYDPHEAFLQYAERHAEVA